MTDPNQRRPIMKATVANAQVSSSSVSHVLNDSRPVAPERQRRVRNAVRLLEYARDKSGVTEPTRDALVSVAVHGREADTMTELETKVQLRESVCRPVDEA